MKTENNNPQEHDELGCWPTKSLMKYCEEHFKDVTYWKTQSGQTLDLISVFPGKNIVVNSKTIINGLKITKKEEVCFNSEAYKIDMTELTEVDSIQANLILKEIG